MNLPLTLLALIALHAGDSQKNRAVFEAQSRYSHIIVRDVGDSRELQFDNVTQSSVRPGDPKALLLDYTQTSMLGLCFSEPKRVLMIGLGGASMPRFVHAFYPSAQIEIVELDQAVVDVAKKFFDYKDEPGLRVVVADGAAYLSSLPAETKFDLIFLDAYAPDVIPPALATTAFFKAVKAHLVSGGAAVSNVWGPPSAGYDEMVATQRGVFDEVYIVRARMSGNHIFVAVPTARRLTAADLAARADALVKAKGFSFDLGDVVRKGFQPGG